MSSFRPHPKTGSQMGHPTSSFPFTCLWLWEETSAPPSPRAPRGTWECRGGCRQGTLESPLENTIEATLLFHKFHRIIGECGQIPSPLLQHPLHPTTTSTTTANPKLPSVPQTEMGQRPLRRKLVPRIVPSSRNSFFPFCLLLCSQKCSI